MLSGSSSLGLFVKLLSDGLISADMTARQSENAGMTDNCRHERLEIHHHEVAIVVLHRSCSAIVVRSKSQSKAVIHKLNFFWWLVLRTSIISMSKTVGRVGNFLSWVNLFPAVLIAYSYSCGEAFTLFISSIIDEQRYWDSWSLMTISVCALTVTNVAISSQRIHGSDAIVVNGAILILFIRPRKKSISNADVLQHAIPPLVHC